MERIQAIEVPRLIGDAGYRRIAALAAALHRAHEAVAAWAGTRRNAATRRELQRLSDHTLRDIGLHRSQIDGLFR